MAGTHSKHELFDAAMAWFEQAIVPPISKETWDNVLILMSQLSLEDEQYGNVQFGLELTPDETACEAFLNWNRSNQKDALGGLTAGASSFAIISFPKPRPAIVRNSSFLNPSKLTEVLRSSMTRPEEEEAKPGLMTVISKRPIPSVPVNVTQASRTIEFPGGIMVAYQVGALPSAFARSYVNSPARCTTTTNSRHLCGKILRL